MQQKLVLTFLQYNHYKIMKPLYCVNCKNILFIDYFEGQQFLEIFFKMSRQMEPKKSLPHKIANEGKIR